MVKKTKGFCSADLHQLVDEIVNNKLSQTIDDTLINNELDKAIKNHVKYTARVSEEAARRRKQDKIQDKQLESLRIQTVIGYGALGAMVGGGVAACIVYMPVIYGGVIAKFAAGGAASAGAATATTGTVATAGATATAGTAVAAGSTTVAASTAAIKTGAAIGGMACAAAAGFIEINDINQKEQ